MRGNKNNTNASPSPHKDGARESAARDNNQPDSGASTFQEGTTLMPQSIMEADNSSQMMDQSNTSQEVSNKILKLTDTYDVLQLPRGLDVDYVRNILLKYLEYMASGDNEKMALTLEKVLFTVLNASPDDLASLEKTRQANNRGIWSYFYDLPNTKVAKPIKPGVRSFGSLNTSFGQQNTSMQNNNSFGSANGQYRM